MASLNYSDPKLRKALPRPMMLKDYLLDDLTSCSSNGFRSFPRRPCCTTVRFLLETDLKAGDLHGQPSRLLRGKSKAAWTTKSALHLASEAMAKAVKLLPFTSVKSQMSLKPSKPKRAFLPRSLSRKLLKRSFWKKTDKGVEHWTSLGDLLEQKQIQTRKQKTLASVFSVSVTTTATNSNSETNSNSWSDSDFTSDYLHCLSGNSENSCENGVVDGVKIGLPEKVVSKRVGVTAGSESVRGTTNSADVAKKQWANEKEQFSPVSVLEFPFEEEEAVTSPFRSRLARIEGTKQMVMQKIRRFEALDPIEPVDLDKRIESLEFSDESVDHSLLLPCYVSTKSNLSICKEERREAQLKGLELLNLMKVTIPSIDLKFNAGNLLLDFIAERKADGYPHNNAEFDNELLSVASDWMGSQPQEVLLGWEVQRNRQVYIMDMEKEGRWGALDEDRGDVAVEVEVKVFASLLDELLLDLFSCWMIN